MSTPQKLAPIERWIAEPLARDVAQSIGSIAAADDVVHVAVMPDVHRSGEVCVGLAVATRRLLYPAAVGNDIGCGMAAIRFDATADLLSDERAAARVLSGLHFRVPSLKHPTATACDQLPEHLHAQPLSDPRLEKLKSRDGRLQLGTLGRGNHFVELQADTLGSLWLTIHSGSRGIGQAIAAHHQRAGHAANNRRALAAFDADSHAGQAYLNDVAWAIAYADANRLAMLSAASNLLGELFGIATVPNTLVHANHNHVRREQHFGELLWVHRKGAQSAQIDEPGIIPGSMGTSTYLVAGRGHPPALCSSSHGAGRALSRSEAARSISVGRLQRELRGVLFDQRQSKRLCDEAPSAYKNIHAVMRAQRELTRIDCELRPLLSYKG